MIKVEAITKRYGTTPALEGISFETAQGETFGLLGPNGAGKTTMIKLLCGLLRADEGTVWLDGKTNPRIDSVRLSLGVVPQTLAIYEELSALENLEFFGRLYGLGGRHLKQRVGECLELAGLSDRRKERVSHFSGGMKRRLNLVCAFLHEPPILLLDEPTVGVDPQSRNLIFETIEALKRQGRTILYTTHYMEEAQRLCDRVAILDQGRIVAMDPVGTLIARHGGPSHIEAEPAACLNDPEVLRAFIDDEGVRFESSVVRFQTTRPLEALARLNQSGVAFRSLKVQAATLEDVFLNLTGRRLRDQ